MTQLPFKTLSIRVTLAEYERLTTVITKCNEKRIPGYHGRLTLAGVAQDLTLEWLTKREEELDTDNGTCI